MVYCNWYLVDYLYFKVGFQCNSEEIEPKETDISWCRLENIIMKYKRGRRACLNLIRDSADNYWVEIVIQEL